MPIKVDPEETFHVLFGQNVREMDLDALDLAYRAEAIDESTLIWQEGLGEWLRLDAVIEQLAAQEQDESAFQSLPAPLPAPDVYFVLLGPDDTKQMTLDQLDDAYRLEVIDEATLVWQPGFSEWIRLDQLLALADAAPVPHVSIHPQAVAPAPSASLYPQQAAWSPTPSTLPAPSQAPARSQPQSFGYVIGRPADSTAPVTHSLGPSIDLDELEDLRPRPASPWLRRGALAAAAAVALVGAHRAGLTQPLLPASVASEPSLETPRGVDTFLADLEKRHGLDRLSPTQAEPATAARPEAPAREDAPSEAEPSTASASATPPTATEPSASAESASPSLPPATSGGLPTGSASRFANTLQGKKPVGASSRPTAKPSARKSTVSTKASKGSGLAYDPMNGTL